MMKILPTSPRTPNAAASRGLGLSPRLTMRELIPMAIHMITRVQLNTLRGIRAPLSRYTRNGLNRGILISRSSSHGQLRAKHHDAPSRKTTVGSPGTKTPTAPIPTSRTPAVASSQR
jgi:hypothetical protein